MRDNPDSYAIEIMNDILGGGGFTSRITSRVRSDEGLAYSAGSNFSFGTYNPGVFRGLVPVKEPDDFAGVDIMMEEINRVRTAKVSAEELETAKNQAIEVFPRNFRHGRTSRRHFRAGRVHKAPGLTTGPPIVIASSAVTVDDVQRVAQKYLQPDKLVMLVVGNIDEITKGNPDKPQYSLLKIAKDGQIHRIPLPDPLTLVYPPRHRVGQVSVDT